MYITIFDFNVLFQRLCDSDLSAVISGRILGIYRIKTTYGKGISWRNNSCLGNICSDFLYDVNALLFTPVSITSLIDTEDACFGLNASRPIAKGDLKWRDALLVAHRVNSNDRTGGE